MSRINIRNVGRHLYDGTRWIENIVGAYIRPLMHRAVGAIALSGAARIEKA